MSESETTDKKKQPIYFCQRCKNHGQVAPRRAHQRQCPFKTCVCVLCKLIDHRRIVMRTRNQIHVSEGIPSYARMSDARNTETVPEKKTRKPRCFLCSGHGRDEILKDHKRRGCPFERCTCGACMLGRQYRRLMAVQTKQRRDQTREDSTQIIEVKEHVAGLTPPSARGIGKQPKGFSIEDILGSDSQSKTNKANHLMSDPISLPPFSTLPTSMTSLFLPFDSFSRFDGFHASFENSFSSHLAIGQKNSF